jgi:hypothetical protein
VEIPRTASVADAVMTLSRHNILSASVRIVDAPEDASWIDKYLGEFFRTHRQYFGRTAGSPARKFLALDADARWWVVLGSSLQAPWTLKESLEWHSDLRTDKSQRVSDPGVACNIHPSLTPGIVDFSGIVLWVLDQSELAATAIAAGAAGVGGLAAGAIGALGAAALGMTGVGVAAGVGAGAVAAATAAGVGKRPVLQL